MTASLIRRDPEDVVELAYNLWLARGFHSGSPEEDLLTATRMLGGETSGLFSVPKPRNCELVEESRTDEVEKFLADLKSIEDRKQNLIDDLLRRAAAIKAFDHGKNRSRPTQPT